MFVVFTLYYEGDKTKKDGMGETYSAHTGGEKYKIFFGKSEWKRPLERPRHGWKDYIETGVREIWSEGIDWIYLAQDQKIFRAVVNRDLNFCVL